MNLDFSEDQQSLEAESVLGLLADHRPDKDVPFNQMH